MATRHGLFHWRQDGRYFWKEAVGKVYASESAAQRAADKLNKSGAVADGLDAGDLVVRGEYVSYADPPANRGGSTMRELHGNPDDLGTPAKASGKLRIRRGIAYWPTIAEADRMRRAMLSEFPGARVVSYGLGHAVQTVEGGDYLGPDSRPSEETRRKVRGSPPQRTPWVDVWEERDNLQIVLYVGVPHDPNTSRAVAVWTDDDARSLFEDGFFDRRRLTTSVIEYAQHLGILP